MQLKHSAFPFCLAMALLLPGCDHPRAEQDPASTEAEARAEAEDADARHRDPVVGQQIGRAAAPDIEPPPPPPSPAIAGTAPEADGDALVRFTGKVAEASSAATCAMPGFVPPVRFKVFAAGAYAGRDLGYQIDQSGHQATRMDVAVNHAREPVVLMLGAYEPTVWNIGWSPSTRIAAVLVSGYHRQAVAGLPADVPVLISSHDNRGACGYFYVTEKRLAQLNPIATRLFDRPVDMVYLAREGSVTIGDAVSAASLVTSPRIAPDSFRDLSAPLAGEAGLRDAIAKGLLREARRSDMDAWQQARAAVDRSTGTLPPVAGQSARPAAPHDVGLRNGYVVLKPMALPAGLYGGHSATFIVPKGVPRPTGNPGHSAIYDFNTLTCAGAVCEDR